LGREHWNDVHFWTLERVYAVCLNDFQLVGVNAEIVGPGGGGVENAEAVAFPARDVNDRRPLECGVTNLTSFNVGAVEGPPPIDEGGIGIRKVSISEVNLCNVLGCPVGPIVDGNEKFLIV